VVAVGSLSFTYRWVQYYNIIIAPVSLYNDATKADDKSDESVINGDNIAYTKDRKKNVNPPQ